jgi:hypothetical protein
MKIMMQQSPRMSAINYKATVRRISFVPEHSPQTLSRHPSKTKKPVETIFKQALNAIREVGGESPTTETIYNALHHHEKTPKTLERPSALSNRSLGSERLSLNKKQRKPSIEKAAKTASGKFYDELGQNNQEFARMLKKKRP